MTALQTKRPTLSRVAESCLFTSGCAALADPRHVVPDHYTNRSAAVRLHWARMILEEALETVDALGVEVRVQIPLEHPLRGMMQDSGCIIDGDFTILKTLDDVQMLPTREPDLEKIIDGCCDTVYVAVGCMVQHGAADLPHLEEVCNRNDAKFPGGVAIVNEAGKWLKPEGWYPPDHKAVIGYYDGAQEFPRITKELINGHGKRPQPTNASHVPQVPEGVSK